MESNKPRVVSLPGPGVGGICSWVRLPKPSFAVPQLPPIDQREGKGLGWFPTALREQELGFHSPASSCFPPFPSLLARLAALPPRGWRGACSISSAILGVGAEGRALTCSSEAPVSGVGGLQAEFERGLSSVRTGQFAAVCLVINTPMTTLQPGSRLCNFYRSLFLVYTGSLTLAIFAVGKGKLLSVP